MGDVVCKKCGSMNDFHIVKKSIHNMAYCNGCDSFIKNISYAKQKFYFGKYAGCLISENGDCEYMKWFLGSVEKISPAMREALENRIKELRETEQNTREDWGDYHG